jgi:hypothetical protein
VITEIDEAIITYLTPGRADLITQSLEYCSWFCCPVCDRYGNADQEPTRTVLYRKIGMAGGVSSDFSDGPFRADTPTLVRWWLARTHIGCRTAPVQPWSQLPPPGSALSGRPDSARPDPTWAALPPADSWSAAVTVQGLPVLHWQQAAPVAHVMRFDSHDGIGTERLVDVLTETMQDRAVQQLRDEDLVLDAVTDLAPLDGWYCQLSGRDTVTVWTPGPWRATFGRLPGEREALRAPLCTIGGLPPQWIAEVAARQRMLLVMTPKGIKHTTTVRGLVTSWYLDRPVLGGIMAAGVATDRDRHTVTPHRPATRTEGRSTRPAVAPIDVEDLWTAASARATILIDAYRHDWPDRWCRYSIDPAQLLALVLVALCRHDGVEPAQATLADVACRLADGGGLVRWLDVLLTPTSLAERLAEMYRFERHDLSAAAGAFIDLREQARVAVERQRLIDAGGVRVGDHVLIIPGAEADIQTVGSGVIRDVSALTWYAGRTPQPSPSCTTPTCQFDIDTTAHPLPSLASSTSLLLADADADDPRATPHAADVAVTDLWTWWPSAWPERWNRDPATVQRDLAYARRMLRRRAAHHTSRDVQQILDTLHRSPDRAFHAAANDAVTQLRCLTHPRGQDRPPPPPTAGT